MMHSTALLQIVVLQGAVRWAVQWDAAARWQC